MGLELFFFFFFIFFVVASTKIKSIKSASKLPLLNPQTQRGNQTERLLLYSQCLCVCVCKMAAG